MAKSKPVQAPGKVKLDTVKITGSGASIVLLVNGQPVQRCTAFKVLSRSPDHPTVVTLEIDAEVEIELPAVVTEIPSSA